MNTAMISPGPRIDGLLSSRPLQVAMDFTRPGSTADVLRKPIVRKGAIGRYNEAIQYLREELKNGVTSDINCVEFSSTFGVTSSFLILVTHLGAIEPVDGRGLGKKGSKVYIARPALATITGQHVLDFRRGFYPNAEPTACVVPQHLLDKTPQQRAGFVAAMNQTRMVTPDQPAETSSQPEVGPEAEPVFLVGYVPKESQFFQAHTNSQFTALDDARQHITKIASGIGQKLAIVQVIEVVESSITLQPATL
jgi:hypothetical protein